MSGNQKYISPQYNGTSNGNSYNEDQPDKGSIVHDVCFHNFFQCGNLLITIFF